MTVCGQIILAKTSSVYDTRLSPYSIHFLFKFDNVLATSDIC